MCAFAPRLLVMVLLVLSLTGCVPTGRGSPAGDPMAGDPRPSAVLPAAAPSDPVPTRAAAPAPTTAPSSTPPISPRPTRPAPLQLAAGPGLPISATAAILTALAAHGIAVVPAPPDAASPADLHLSIGQTAGAWLAYERILVPAGRFSSYLEGVTGGELAAAWRGQGQSPNFKALYVAQTALADLVALWGPPGPSVHALQTERVADALWQDPHGLGILPFDALTPRVRALHLDALSATDNRLAARQWPLATRAWLSAATPRGAAVLDKLTGAAAAPGAPLLTNRDPARLTVLVMTGVTALTRGTAEAIERAHDDAFPARLVGPELAAADLTTTSNEVSFVDNCPVDNRAGVMQFCSRPGYFDALALSGIDLVGLTGNHLNDYGTVALTNTLAFYTQHGIRTYGGGVDERAAAAPLFVTDHGNRLAFLGANQFGPAGLADHDGAAVSAWAGPHSPGSARYDREQMMAAVRDARQHADVVLAELQWTEFDAAGDYTVTPLPNQVADFHALADAGADVVTGVQAHAPQALALRGRGIILYGLGNLYFDQTFSWPTRTGIVARHTIYAGRLLNTELLITVIDANKQVRWATAAERLSVLKSIFGASGW
jgi:hypothetical protein